MSGEPANDVSLTPEQRLDAALDSGTEHERAIALRDWLEKSLLVREGEVLTREIARDRASNTAAGLMEFLYGRLA